MGEADKYYERRFSICAICHHIIKPSGAVYEPHPESICATEKIINFVIGEEVSVLCKERNSNGNCIWFERRQ
jgi:hypothetical protein